MHNFNQNTHKGETQHQRAQPLGFSLFPAGHSTQPKHFEEHKVEKQRAGNRT